MTALPQQRPRRLSAEEFAALPEAPDAHWELQEGAVVTSPRPFMAHQRRLGKLFTALDAQCPDADAGVPHYWMVDSTGPEVELTVAHLADEFGYADERPVRGVVTVDQPFPLSVDLTTVR